MIPWEGGHELFLQQLPNEMSNFKQKFCHPCVSNLALCKTEQGHYRQKCIKSPIFLSRILGLNSRNVTEVKQLFAAVIYVSSLVSQLTGQIKCNLSTYGSFPAQSQIKNASFAFNIKSAHCVGLIRFSSKLVWN